MSRRLFRGILFVLGYLCISVGAWHAFDGQPSGIRIADGAVPHGFSCRSFVDTDGTVSPYVCFIPNCETKDSRPAEILYLHL